MSGKQELVSKWILGLFFSQAAHKTHGPGEGEEGKECKTADPYKLVLASFLTYSLGTILFKKKMALTHQVHIKASWCGDPP